MERELCEAALRRRIAVLW